LLTRFGNIQTTKFCYELREKYTALGWMSDNYTSWTFDNSL
jgi:hypothetical protein